MFAMFRYDKMEFRERTNVHQTLISKKQLDLENQLKYNDNKQWLRGNIGMNYMFDENNSIGIKYSIQGSPRYDSKLYTTSKVSLDGKVFDRLQNFTSSETDNELNHQLNAYYTGRVGNLEIDFNADYYQSGYLLARKVKSRRTGMYMLQVMWQIIWQQPNWCCPILCGKENFQ